MAKISIMAEMLGVEAVHSGLQKIQTDVAAVGHQADAAFDEAAKGAKEFSGAMEGTLTAVKAVGVALAALVTAEFVGWARRSYTEVMRLSDQLDNMSEKLGISVTALQELAAVGMDSGITLEDIGGALTRLAANAGRAGIDIESASGALAKLGIDARDSSGNMRDLEELLLDVADAVRGAETNTEKLSIATQAFGREGAKLLPILNQGAAELLLQREEAKRLGLVLSDELVTAAAEAGDAMERWSTRLRNYLAIGTFEMLKFVGLIDRTRQEVLTIELEGLEELRTSTLKGIDRATENNNFPVLEALGRQLQEVETKIATTKAALEELGKPITLPGLPEPPGGGGGGGGGIKPEDAVVLSEELSRKLMVMGPLVQQEVAGFEALNKSLQQFATQGLALIASPMEQLAALQTKLNEAVAAGLLTVEEASEIYAEYATRLGEAGDTQAALLGGLENSLTGLVSGTIDGLAEMESGWKSFGKTMASVAESFVASLLRMIIAETLLKSIGGAITGLFGGPVSLGSAVGAGGVAYPLPPPIPAAKLATGGSHVFTRPSLISVAEMGPELIEASPLSGGSRSDKNGGTIINQYFDGVQGEATIQRAVAEGLRKAMPGFVETSVQTVRQRHRMDPGYLR